MKKSLIALAVMAAAGAASAQSSVQLYGIVDIWFGSVKDGVGAQSETKLDAGGVNGNRFGLKGSEDLGGGLKANFQLEQGFNMDDGSAVASTAFNRQAWVGLSGGFCSGIRCIQQHGLCCSSAQYCCLLHPDRGRFHRCCFLRHGRKQCSFG